MTLFSDLRKIQSPTGVLENAYKKISSTDKFAYCAGAIFCLLVNAFIYTNTCFAHDSIQIFSDSTGISNGRFLVGPLLELVNRMQIPWVIGLITCFLMGFVIVFLSKIFKLNNKISIVLCAGFAVTSEAMVVSHAYFSSVYIYVLSLLFAVLSVYIVDKKRYGIPLSIVFLCLSMMCYQAYIATAIALFIFKMLLNIFENKSGIKRQLLLTVKYASISVAAAVLYYAIWKIVLKILGETVVEYYAYNNLGVIPTTEELIDRLDYAWSFAIQLFYRNDIINTFPALMMCGCLISIIVLSVFIIKSIKRRRLVFTLVYIVTYILSVNLMYIISGTVIHSLTIFSIILPFLALLYLFDNVFSKKKSYNIVSWLSLILSVVMVFGQIVCANSLYLKIKLNYDNAWSYSTRLIDRLEQTEGFDEKSKVIIISNDSFSPTKYPPNPNISERVRYDTRIQILNDLFRSGNAITYADTLKWFIQQEMDMNIDITTDPKEFVEREDIREMPVFPAEESIAVIDGAYVIKISD